MQPSRADTNQPMSLIINADCIEHMNSMLPNSVDSIVTDPPYHLTSIVKRFGKDDAAPAQFGTDGVYARSSKGFMGQTWDGGDIAFKPEIWAAAYRVAKPGAYLLAFGGTRTYHRMAVAIEDANWEIRDCIMWVYGSGFPKSHNVSKAIDKAAGAKRKVVGVDDKINIYQDNKNHKFYAQDSGNPIYAKKTLTAPATAEAAQWDGWGTALKPAWEPIIIARKALDGTVAQNVQKWGTGAMNIDGCRVGTDDIFGGGAKGTSGFAAGYEHDGYTVGSPLGRWPANLIHDGSDEVVAGFPVNVKGVYGAKSVGKVQFMDSHDQSGRSIGSGNGITDTGSAARFFYCAKAGRLDRDAGCEELEERRGCSEFRKNDDGTAGIQSRLHGATIKGRNHHPTVKPTALMRYLCRLVTQPNGTVLDPFCGSGSTGKGAVLEGFQFIGIEKDPEYYEIANSRIAACLRDNTETRQVDHKQKELW